MTSEVPLPPVRSRPGWRLVLAGLLGFTLGAAAAQGGATWLEASIGRELEATASGHGWTLTQARLQLLRSVGVQLEEVSLAGPAGIRLQVAKLSLIPASLDDLWARSRGSWLVVVQDWRLELEPATTAAPRWRLAGSSIRVVLSRDGGLRLTFAGTLPSGTPMRGTVAGRIRSGSPQTLVAEPAQPLALAELAPLLAAAARQLGVREDHPLLAALQPAPPESDLENVNQNDLIRGLRFGALRWDRVSATLAVDELAVVAPPGRPLPLVGQARRVWLGWQPDGPIRPRSVRVDGLTMTLAIRGWSAPPPVAPPEFVGPPEPPPGPRRLPGRLVHKLDQMVQLFRTPLLDGLQEVAVTDLEVRLTETPGAPVGPVVRGDWLLYPGQLVRTQLTVTGGPWASEARLHGRLDWPEFAPAGGVRLRGELALQEGRLFFAPLAPDPVTDLELFTQLAVEFEPAGGDFRLVAEPLTVQRVRTRLEVAGELPDHDRPRLRARFTLPPQRCQLLADALPPGLAPLLEGMQLAGEVAGGLRIEVDFREAREPVRRLELIPPGLEDCTVRSLGKIRVERLNRPFVQEIRLPPRQARGQPRGQAKIEVGPGLPDYVPLPDLPLAVRRAMLVTENASFYDGGPISLGLLRGALNLDLTHRRYVYGGSTISQQLVKNLFLTRDKHLARKLQEAFIAWRLEQILSKDRIFELYVNCIEFGPGIYGIERAARYYFGHGARELTPAEGVFLASIKPGPRDGPHIARGARPAWWLDKMQRVLERLAREGVISRAEQRDAQPEALVFRLPATEGTTAGPRPGDAEPAEAEDEPDDPDLEELPGGQPSATESTETP